MEDQIKQARQEGYSDSEIAQFLISQGKDLSNTSINLSQPQQDTNQNSGGDWNDFIQKAKDIASKEDFPPSVLLGQAALESGRGQAAPGNNYFGIKGEGNAGSNNLSTQEADSNGNYYTTQSAFRAYKSPEDSIHDYIDLIKNQYPDAYAKRGNPDEMLAAIKAGGYATSPDYVNSVSSTPEYQQNK